MEEAKHVVCPDCGEFDYKLDLSKKNGNIICPVCDHVHCVSDRITIREWLDENKEK